MQRVRERGKLKRKFQNKVDCELIVNDIRFCFHFEISVRQQYSNRWVNMLTMYGRDAMMHSYSDTRVISLQCHQMIRALALSLSSCSQSIDISICINLKPHTHQYSHRTQAINIKHRLIRLNGANQFLSIAFRSSFALCRSRVAFISFTVATNMRSQIN